MARTISSANSICVPRLLFGTPGPGVGAGWGYFDRAMRCCSFFAWRRIERFSCRPFSSMCFAVLSARLSADLIVSALIRACITFFPNAFPIAFSLVENHSRLVEWAVVLPFVGMACGHLRNGNSRFAPAAPLAGALLISISAGSVSCCAHLSAPDVWQLVVLGAAASPLVTLRGCACCQLLFRAEPQGVFEGDVKGGQGATPAAVAWLAPSAR